MRSIHLTLFLALMWATPPAALSQSATNLHFGSVRADSESRTSPTFVRDVLPIVLGKCYTCHNNQTRFLPDWTDYATAFSHRIEIKRRVWDSWLGRYYRQPMPAGNSPQCLAMTEADRQIIRRWVEQGAQHGETAPPVASASRSDRMESGRRLFGTVCLPCHQANGQGVPGRFPPLAASDFLNTDKNRAVATLLNGRTGEITVNGRKYNGSMPRLPFDDAQIASVLTFVYGSFGNSSQDVTPDDVKRLRSLPANSWPAPKPGPAGDKPSPWE